MGVTRNDLIVTARSWVGTPFVHQGRVKGRAVDCVGLALCVLEELQLMGASASSGSWTRKPEFTQYGPEPAKGKVWGGCVSLLVQKDFNDCRAGDILSLRAPAEPCHVAFVSERKGILYLIHAYNGGPRKCVEHVLDSVWRSRIAGCFAIPEVED